MFGNKLVHTNSPGGRRVGLIYQSGTDREPTDLDAWRYAFEEAPLNIWRTAATLINEKRDIPNTEYKLCRYKAWFNHRNLFRIEGAQATHNVYPSDKAVQWGGYQSGYGGTGTREPMAFMIDTEFVMMIKTNDTNPIYHMDRIADMRQYLTVDPDDFEHKKVTISTKLGTPDTNWEGTFPFVWTDLEPIPAITRTYTSAFKYETGLKFSDHGSLSVGPTAWFDIGYQQVTSDEGYYEPEIYAPSIRIPYISTSSYGEYPQEDVRVYDYRWEVTPSGYTDIYRATPYLSGATVDVLQNFGGLYGSNLKLAPTFEKDTECYMDSEFAKYEHYNDNTRTLCYTGNVAISLMCP